MVDDGQRGPGNEVAARGLILAGTARSQEVLDVAIRVESASSHSGVQQVTVRNQHVVPRGNRWAVRKAGAERVTRHFDTQREAIEVARELARSQGAEVFIHGRDGRIRERDSHGNDPFPPRG